MNIYTHLTPGELYGEMSSCEKKEMVVLLRDGGWIQPVSDGLTCLVGQLVKAEGLGTCTKEEAWDQVARRYREIAEAKEKEVPA